MERKPPDVTTLLGNLNRPVKLRNPNTSAEAKLCLLFFIPTQEIVCREAKVLKQLFLAKHDKFSRKFYSRNSKKPPFLTIKNNYKEFTKSTNSVNSRKTSQKLQSYSQQQQLLQIITKRFH